MRELAEVYGELQFLGTEIIAVPMSGAQHPGAVGGNPPVLYPVVTDGAADIVRRMRCSGAPSALPASGPTRRRPRT